MFLMGFVACFGGESVAQKTSRTFKQQLRHCSRFDGRTISNRRFTSDGAAQRMSNDGGLLAAILPAASDLRQVVLAVWKQCLVRCESAEHQLELSERHLDAWHQSRAVGR